MILKRIKDRLNLERISRLRYAFQSGQSSIHGDTLFEVETQEGQSFAFHANTGQGTEENNKGPGSGKSVLYTPGMSIEVLGEGLKVRGDGDISQLPAKIIKCKKGDMIFECENGNILLRAKNVFVDADGGGQDGQFVAKATRVAEIDAPDIRLQGEKISIRSTKDISIVSQAFMELSYGFAMASSFGDVNFGAISKIAKQAITRIDPSLNDTD